MSANAGGAVLAARSAVLSQPTTLALLSVIIAAGVILRWRLLTATDFSVDEGASVVLAQLSWSSFLAAMRDYEANMSLYYLFLRGWLHLGDSEVAIRSLSVVIGAAAIFATYLLGKRLFGEKTGLVSAALAAVNAFQIRYSWEARSYGLVMLLSILSSYCFVRAIDDEEHRKRYWAGYVIASALGVYAHVFFFLVVAAQWMSLGRSLLRNHLKSLLWAAAGFLLLTGPMIWFVLTKNQGQINWASRPTVFTLLEFFKFFTGYGGSALLALMGALCLLAVYTAYRERGCASKGLDTWQRVRFVAWWLVFPMASTILVSFVKPIFSDRFMAISAPAVVLLAGKGLVDLEQIFPRRHLFAVSVIVVIGLSLWGIHRYDASPNAAGDSWRSATGYVLAHQKPGDAAFFYRASGSRVFTYYTRRAIEEHAATTSPVVIFPADVTNTLLFNVDPSEEQVRHALGQRGRVWLVLQHWEGNRVRESAMQTIRNTLGRSYCLSQEQEFRRGANSIAVLLYVRCEAHPDQ